MAGIPAASSKATVCATRDDRGRVDDYASGGVGSQGAHEQSGLRARVALFDHVTQIGAMKAGDVLIGIAQAELLDDVVADVARGAGGEGGDGAIGEMLSEAGELAIFGTEFVAPLGNAMRFVNCEERNGHLTEPFDCVLAGQALG